MGGKITKLIDEISKGLHQSIARAITIIENQLSGSDDILFQLPTNTNTTVVGITGPPGAGKSTLTEALLDLLVNQKNLNVAVLAVDPSSPFNLGALLGDRIRLSRFYVHPKVFIRSLASRGTMGGLNPRFFEILDMMKVAGFHYIIVETVGVGQNEIDIAAAADVTVLTLVPEGGDEIQTIKSGIMEIADVFVINKSDRPDAVRMLTSIQHMLHQQDKSLPVISTVAIEGIGIEKLYQAIQDQKVQASANESRKDWMIQKRLWQMMATQLMTGWSAEVLFHEWKRYEEAKKGNLYQFIQSLSRAGNL